MQPLRFRFAIPLFATLVFQWAVVVHAQSLGDKIRERSATTEQSVSGRNDGQSSELADDELTEKLAPSATEKRDNLDERNEVSDSRNRSVDSYIQRLRKPIQEIEVVAHSAGQTVPENRAAVHHQGIEPTAIIALGVGVPIPARYTLAQSHRPLYYEQKNLERCGAGFGICQNAVSAAQFLGNTILLPYKIGKQRPDCPILGGGDCRSCQNVAIGDDVLPIDRRGVLLELAAIAGFSFLLL